MQKIKKRIGVIHKDKKQRMQFACYKINKGSESDQKSKTSTNYCIKRDRNSSCISLTYIMCTQTD